VNARDLLEAVAALPCAAVAPAPGDGVEAAVVIAGVEVAQAAAASDRRLRAVWRARNGGGTRPLLLVTDAGDGTDSVRVLGPQDGDGRLRSVAGHALASALERACEMSDLEA